MDNKSLSHTRWKCQYHIVFILKYRKKVLYGKVREDVREMGGALQALQSPTVQRKHTCMTMQET